MRRLAPVLALLLVVVAPPLRAAPATDDFPWQPWGPAAFEQAKREGKFVLLSLQSWWCPWCHTMNVETYADPEVRATIDAHFVPVRVDQDSRPDISQRFERWGWPATVLFGADGTEIVKLRGFYSPGFFLPILRETVRDPSPVDYGTPGGPERERRLATRLPEAARGELAAFLDEAYDRENGGWGKSKLVDRPTFDFVLEQAWLGNAPLAAMGRETVSKTIQLIDGETGAVAQVAARPDWSKIHREFPMFAQEGGLRGFSLAWALWGDPQFKQAADRVYAFLTTTLSAPSGAFYASMGMERGEPGVDRREYARETGQAILGLLAYHDWVGVPGARERAIRAARWALAERARGDGGFRHAAVDEAGPYLVDTLAMGEAFLALHRSTGDREWLTHAAKAAGFILANFVDDKTGGFLSSAASAAPGIAPPIKQKDDNVSAVRFLAALATYTGEQRHRTAAETGMGYLTSPPVLDAYLFLPGVLQAEHELLVEPIHVTIVAAKDDPHAGALHRAALAHPAQHKRVEWWDRREGPLPNPDVPYPDYPEAAAFACTSNFCSQPVTDPRALRAALDDLRNRR